MLDTYLSVLRESLEKKITALKYIEEINNAQEEILKEESFDMEAFDRTVDEKDNYISELNKLDEGFETLYEKIKAELLPNKVKYAVQIKQLQSLMAYRSQKQYQGKPIDFVLKDPFGNRLRQDQLYHPVYSERCDTCGSRLICNGCSFCGKCGLKTGTKQKTGQ